MANLLFRRGREGGGRFAPQNVRPLQKLIRELLSEKQSRQPYVAFHQRPRNGAGLLRLGRYDALRRFVSRRNVILQNGRVEAPARAFFAYSACVHACRGNGNRQLYGKEVGNPSGGVFSTFRFLAGEFLGNSRHKGVRQRGKRTFGVQKTQQTQRGRQRGIRQSVHHS